MSDRSTLPERMLSARQAIGYSFDDVARRIGVPVSKYMRWERGVGRPTHDRLKFIAAALNVSVDWLMGLSNEPRAPSDEPPSANVVRLSDRRKK